MASEALQNASSHINRIGTQPQDEFPRNSLDLDEVFKQQFISK